MTVRLVVHLDDRTLRIPLREGDVVVGSASECDVRVPHFTVSRRHAELRLRDGIVEIEDLGSRNGTTVAGRPLITATAITPPATLSFGGVEATLEVVEEADLEAAVVLEVSAATQDDGGVDLPDTPATSSLGAVKRFTMQHLPVLLKRLAEGAGAEAVGREVGAALLDVIPGSAVEIVTTAGGTVFVGGDRSSRADGALVIPVDGAGLSIRVAFASPIQERGYAPLVEACGMLVGLAHAPSAEASASLRPAPPPPAPATVAPAVRHLYGDALRVAQGDVSVLIRGESGTGKEILARYIHAASRRAAAPFVPLNCAALPRDLLEAELFGVEKGTATGVDARAGKFELADGGTLFLDEIADMAPDTQAKILRVLQEGEVYRLGAHAPRPARVRVISATNRDLDAMRAGGTFRSDLYHRIADWDVTVPALRERRADIPNLAAHFLGREAQRRGVRVAGISRAALDALRAAPWPGNIRQLEREMARVVLFLEDGQLLERSHLKESVLRDGGSTPTVGLRGQLEQAERAAIVRALAACGGDVTAAAETLDIGRSTLYRRMKELGIEP